MTDNAFFKDKTLLITGGTGSFGNAVLNRFLDTEIKEIRISIISLVHLCRVSWDSLIWMYPDLR